MKISRAFITLALAVAACFTLAGNSFSVEYQHSATADKMTFDWSVDGETLAVKLTAPTTGWVGIGFNPSKKMKDANFIVGYVKEGKVKIFDEFGTHPTKHGKDSKKGGKSDVVVVGGSEEGSTTTLEFTIPLNSGDKLDSPLDPAADTVVLLAYGPERDSIKVKHKFQKSITVNLASGAVK